MLTAVASEMDVVVVDHRDARAHEARDREHRDAGSQCEGGVGMAQVVEVAERVDAGRNQGQFPMTPAEAAEVDIAAARVREEQRPFGCKEAGERLERNRRIRRRAPAKKGRALAELFYSRSGGGLGSVAKHVESLVDAIEPDLACRRPGDAKADVRQLSARTDVRAFQPYVGSRRFAK